MEWLHCMSKNEFDDIAEGAKHKDVMLTSAVQSLKGRVLHLYKDAAKAVYDKGPYKVDSAYSKFSCAYDTWMSLLQEDKEVHLKRFFAASCSALKQGQRKNPMSRLTSATVASAAVLPSTTPPVSVALAPVATVNPISTKHLSVSLDEFDIPEDCLPRNTLQCLYRNAEALLNEPGAIMQAASSDPRMMTVNSRHGKVPLLVKPLKNENQFECNCATYKSLGVCQDTIAVANNLDCLKTSVEGLRKKLHRKRGKKGVNVSAAYNSRLKPSEQGLKANEISKVCRRKRSVVLESWKPSEPTKGTNNTQATTFAMPARVVNFPMPQHQVHRSQLQWQPQQQSQFSVVFSTA